MKKIYDITIIGAGPAGTAAAYFSKKFDKENSYKILLIDSLTDEKYDRYHHMCGEAVSSHIKNDFKDINIKNFVKNQIKYFYEYWGENVLIKSRNEGFILDRAKFLKFLIKEFKKYNGELLIDRVQTFTKKENNLLIKTNNNTIKTKYLIIATGPKIPKNNIIKIEGDISSINLYQIMIEKYSLEQNIIKFYYDQKYKENYKWIFPFGDKVKIGVPFRNKNELKKYDKFNIIRKDIKKVNCGILKKYNFGNILIIGDSAYQNNPLTKGGIRPAINASRLAIQSILKYEDPDYYDLEWKENPFYNKPYNNSCRILRKMNNYELEHHAKPIKYYPLTYPLIISKYRKYLPLYKSYLSSGKYGW